MPPGDLSSRDFWVGEWLVQPRLGKIRRGDQAVHITPRAMAVLVHLAEVDGAVVSRNDILDAIWNRMTVTPDALAQCIAELRKAFRDNPKNPKIIETIPKVGIRLVARIGLCEPVAVETAGMGAAHSGKGVVTDAAFESPDKRPAFARLAAAFAAVLLAGIVLVSVTELQPERVRSIAVLPFAHDGAEDQALESFSDGLHEELLSQLASIGALDKVIARQSVMQYRGTEQSIREIGSALGVATILETTVRRENEAVRVIATLIDAKTEGTIWRSAPYDRELNIKSLFTLQTELAVLIANQLEAVLTEQESVRPARVPTQSEEALVYYQRARDYWRRSNDRYEDLPPALTLLERAVESDPEFAEAWAGLGIVHTAFHWYGIDMSRAHLQEADEAIRTALRLQQDSGEAHLARANYLSRGLNQFEAALAEFSVAEKLIPGEPDLYHLRASVYRRMGEWEKSTGDLDRAIALDPLNVVYLRQQHVNLLHLRQYARADQYLQRILDFAPDDATTQVDRAALGLFRDGAIERPDESLQPARYASGIGYTYVNWLAAFFDLDLQRALRVLDGLDRDFTRAHGAPRRRTLLYARTYRVAGQDELARMYYQTTLDEIGDQLVGGAEAVDADVWRDLAEAQAGLGQRQAALASLERALSSLPPSNTGFERSDLLLEGVLGVLLPLADNGDALRDRALKELAAYLDAPGVWSIEGLARDPRIASLLDDASFLELVRRYRRQ